MYINEQYELVLSATRQKRELFVACLDKIALYEKLKKEEEDSIMAIMNANGFDELYNVKIIKEPYFKSIEVGKLLGLFANQELAKSIVVSVDLQGTEKNLREQYGFTEVAIKPLMEILKKKLSAYRDVLVKK